MEGGHDALYGLFEEFGGGCRIPGLEGKTDNFVDRCTSGERPISLQRLISKRVSQRRE